jgi:hypothetical protein
MSNAVKVLKDEISQMPIPSAWRSTLFAVVEAFKDGDFMLLGGLPGVRPISVEDAARISNNIKSNGARLTRLPEDTWQTSACQWMRGYWDVLVDLYTAEEGASDLVLAVRVHEEGLGYAFEIQSVHVP